MLSTSAPECHSSGHRTSNGVTQAEVTDNFQDRLAAARRGAVEWRERLGVTSCATPEDTARLLAEAVPNAEIMRTELDVKPRAYRHFNDGRPNLKLRSGATPEEDAPHLAWFVGLILHGWLPGETDETLTPDFDWDAHQAKSKIRQRLAKTFADVWDSGLKYAYAADDPRALELLAAHDVDHFPTLQEAREWAADHPDEVSVDVSDVTTTYVLSVLGHLVFMFPTVESEAASA